MDPGPEGGDFCLSPRDIERFAALSHDRHPLHLDPLYCSRTPFGQCLIHGIHGVLLALRGVAGGRPLCLRRLKATLLKPLLPGVLYRTRYARAPGGRCRCTVHCGSSEKLVVDVEYEALESVPAFDASAPEVPVDEQIGHVPPDALPGYAVEGRYGLGLGVLEAFLAGSGFACLPLPPLQLTSLCWISYVLGRVPGRQGLASEYSVEFEAAAPLDRQELQSSAQVTRFDRRFSMMELSGTHSVEGHPGFARAGARAVIRPAPVDHPLEALRESLGTSSALAGRTAVVTGSSRGLGAVIARGLALRGADVAVHCRINRAAAERVCEEIRSLGRRCLLIQGDLRARATWVEIARRTADELGGLDLLVNNAAAPPVPLAFDELTDQEVDTWVTGAVQSAVLGHQALLPALRARKGWVVDLSAQATQSPGKEQAHTVAAKSAIEGLARALSRENPEVRFLLVRAPKMRTDATNGAVDLAPGLPPERVARALLDRLEGAGPAERFTVLEQF